MPFQDRSLVCVDCNGPFTFTAGEQEFYERKGFREVPKRCKACRDARKARRSDGNGHRDGRGDGNGNGWGREARDGNGAHGGDGDGYRPRPARELFDAVCAACGAPARVPFRPAAGRPVYCRDCYGSRQGQGSGYGGYQP